MNVLTYGILPGGESTPTRSGDVGRIGGAAKCDGKTMPWECIRCGLRWDRIIKCDDERACPVCSVVWAKSQGRKGEARLLALQRKWTLPRPRHVVVSWAGEWADSARQLAEAYREVYRTLTTMGSLGGAVVVHPERHRGPSCWFEGLHAHALVFGRVDARKRPEGVVVVNLDAEDRRQGRRSLRGTLTYACDHAAYTPKGHVVRWFGVAGYNRGKLGRHARERAPWDGSGPSCPKCGAESVEAEGPDRMDGIRRRARASHRRSVY